MATLSRRAADAHAAPRLGPGPALRAVIWLLFGCFFAVPLLSMFEFTVRTAHPGRYSFDRWVAVFTDTSGDYDRVYQGLGNSLVLAVVTLVILLLVLLPTMVLIELRLPRLRRAFEAVCLLPLAIPAIVMVVGLAPVYSVVTSIFGSGSWTLGFVYGIIVMPYAYRAIHNNLVAIDAPTLAEAAQSLGAGWLNVFLRVIVPNLRQGLMAATVLTIAVVLGEFTIASLLSRVNLQTALLMQSQSDPFVAVIFALLALLFAFILLVVVGRICAIRRTDSH